MSPKIPATSSSHHFNFNADESSGPSASKSERSGGPRTATGDKSKSVSPSDSLRSGRGRASVESLQRLHGMNISALPSRKTSVASSSGNSDASTSAGFDDHMFPPAAQREWDDIRFSDSPPGSLNLDSSQELTSSNEFQPRLLRRSSTGALFINPAEISSGPDSLSSSRTAFGAMPSNFIDDSFILFEKPAFLSELLKPVQNTQYLDNLRNQLGMNGINQSGYNVGQVVIDFDEELAKNRCFADQDSLYGSTTRGEDSVIGPQAFSTSFRSADMTGDIDLSPSIVALQVGLTMAHETTHVYQYDHYPVINGDAINPEYLRKKFGAKAARQINNAYFDQVNLFETIGYHVELVNLLKYKNLHTVTSKTASHPALKNRITAEENFQLQKLEDTIRLRRDDFFAQLPDEVQSLLLGSNIYAAQDAVIEKVKFLDKNLILPPLLPENERSNATVVPDDKTVLSQ